MIKPLNNRSLCVVLELCSEGSLNNVLYRKKREIDSSFDDRVSIFRESRVQSLGRTTKTRESHGNDLLNTNVNDFEYFLPWAQRLELAVGVCRGIEALQRSLPGYSHNDIKRSPTSLSNSSIYIFFFSHAYSIFCIYSCL